MTMHDAAPADAAIFANEVERTIVVYERENGRAASRTRQMIERYGEVEALGRLMLSADLQKGFRVLRDHVVVPAPCCRLPAPSRSSTTAPEQLPGGTEACSVH